MSGAGLEFWVYLPQMRMSFPTILERARAAEAAGFDGVALMDHLAPPGLTSAGMYDAMTTAAAVAAATERLKVGHLVLCGSFRHPCVLAKEVVSLDHLSGGRFELGLGWGSVPGELERFGLAAEDARTRAGRLAEALDVLAALFTGEDVDYDGDFYTLRGARQSPRPLAGKARMSTQHPVGLAAGPGDVDGVSEVARRRFGGWGGLITGTAERVAEQLTGLAGRGVERFYLQFSDFAMPETLERFGAEVIPAVTGAETR